MIVPKDELVFSLGCFAPGFDMCTREEWQATLSAAQAVSANRVQVSAAHFGQVADGGAPPQIEVAWKAAERRSRLMHLLDVQTERIAKVIDTETADNLVKELDQAGLQTVAVSVLTSWWSGRSENNRAKTSTICDLAVKLGASQVVAANLAPDIDLVVAAAGLAEAAEIAAERGLMVCLEWLPNTPISHIRDARAIIEATGRDNLGYLIDALHWQYQPFGPDWKTLEGLPSERILQVQLCDARLEDTPSPHLEPRTRRFPGDGEIDLVRLLNTISSMGASPIVTAEVLQPDFLSQNGATALAWQVTRTSQEILERARQGGQDRRQQ